MNNFIYLPFIIFFTFISNAYSVEIPACQRNADGRYVFDDSTNEGCAVPADEYRFTLYQVGLCRNFPEFPALSAPLLDNDGNITNLIDTRDSNLFPPSQPALVNNPDNCTTLLRSTNGTQVSIINGGQVTGLVGEQGNQPNPEDRYTHVFAIVGTSLQYSTSKVFTVEQTTAPNTQTTGNKCWTQARTFTVSDVFGDPDSLPKVRCGSVDATLENFGLITQITDCYEPTSVANQFSNFRCFYQRDTRNNVGIWLTDTNLQKVSDADDSKRIVFVQRLPSPLVGVGQNSNSLTLRFSTSEAVGLIPHNPTDQDSNSRNRSLGYATQGNFKFFVDLN